MIHLLKTLYRRLKIAGKILADENAYALYPKETYAHHRLSFAQEGEDLILMELVGRQAQGFFVDIGAHHPQRFSNTYALYLQGWRGLNIDALPGVVEAFSKTRPRDTTVQVGVASKAGSLTYFQFNEPALNTFSRELAEQRDGTGRFRLVVEEAVPTITLAEILDQHLPEGQAIDVLNIDVEGFDLQALQSNDWQRYRPRFVLAEDLSRTDKAIQTESPVAAYLQSLGYQPVARSMRTLFFEDGRQRC